VELKTLTEAEHSKSPLTSESLLRLVKVHPTEIEALKDYVQALYRLVDDFDSMVHIEEGVKSLLKNEALATAYFIKNNENRVGYVILTRYHSVEKGGLTIYIDELYVEENYRRQGAGGRILDQIIAIARAQGAKVISAQTEPYNETAQSFFASKGFRVNPYKNHELEL
jgi:ribosomal protein S18 acetylase RimI-like enzyme